MFRSIKFLLLSVILLTIIFSGIANASDYFLTKEGAKVWNPTPKPGMSATWSGDRDSEGYVTGDGVLQYYLNGTEADRFEGSMTKGKFHGRGKLNSFPMFYDGDFSDGIFHGRGVLAVVPTGPFYNGDFIKGLFDGNGFLQYPNGSKYEGSFIKGLPNGKGTVRLPNGAYYQREVFQSKFHGYDTFYNPDGTIKLQGQWNNGTFIGNS